MKNFILTNWYKLMIGSSLFMASFGFMIYSVTSVNAKDLISSKLNPNYQSIPINSDGSISLKFSDDQLDKIIPKNEDGSINIKLSEQQLKTLQPNTVQEVDIQMINGRQAGCYVAYQVDGKSYYSLAVQTP